MRLRPVSLLLAPLWLLLALALLSSCERPVTGPSVVPPVSGGISTVAVITVIPAQTALPRGGTLLPAPTDQPLTAIPTLASAGLSPTELKYRLLDAYPDFFFCDPDYYPVARDDEGQVALERFAGLQTEQEEFQAILAHAHLSGQASFTAAEKLLIYREHKKLAALHFELIADRYAFQLTTGGEPSYSVQGTIDAAGRITVQQKSPGFATCPICLAAGTRIDTPRGEVFVEDVKAGDPVWTLDAGGERVSMPVLRVARVPVSAGHVLLHVVLSDGRELWASPGHPMADGRPLAELQIGSMLDNARVLSTESVPYAGGATYDLLPGGVTGFYWANGILMGSTLAGGDR